MRFLQLVIFCAAGCFFIYIDATDNGLLIGIWAGMVTFAVTVGPLWLWDKYQLWRIGAGGIERRFPDEE